MTRHRAPPFRLGFGCSSLGSRVGAQDGLQALHAAHEAGVNWFDLAPSYGDGQAEDIFARFAAGRRDSLYICTKVGRVAGRTGAAARLLRPLARRLVAAAPPLRGVVARGRQPAQAHVLTATFIKESLDASLGRLGVEQVDVLALHDPPLPEVMRDEVQRALEDIRKAGKAARIGFAGAAATALEVVRQGLPFRMFQVPFDISGSNVGQVKAALGPRSAMVITHSVRSAMTCVDRSDPGAGKSSVAAALQRLGYDMEPTKALYAAALDLALLDRSNDLVLASMLRPAHLRANLDRLQRTPSASAEAIRTALVVPPAAGESE